MHKHNFIEIRPLILKLLGNTIVLHKLRTITLLFLKAMSPFTIPYHSSPISMPMQNRSKNAKVRARKRSADGQTDTQMVRRVKHNTTPHEKVSITFLQEDNTDIWHEFQSKMFLNYNYKVKFYDYLQYLQSRLKKADFQQSSCKHISITTALSNTSQ